MLTLLTLLLVGLVVLALAGYLIGVALALLHTRRSVTRIADALETTARQTQPIESKLVTINGALSALANGLEAADQHLGRAARVFKL